MEEVTGEGLRKSCRRSKRSSVSLLRHDEAPTAKGKETHKTRKRVKAQNEKECEESPKKKGRRKNRTRPSTLRHATRRSSEEATEEEHSPAAPLRASIWKTVCKVDAKAKEMNAVHLYQVVNKPRRGE
jgi:hypothetical protein